MDRPKQLVLERIIQAPSEVVWRMLTDATLLRRWQPYFTEFKAEAGFETRFMLGRNGGEEYQHICEVTEVEEGRKLTHSWRYEGFAGDSYVTYELEPQGDTTKVTLTHRITEPFTQSNPDFTSDNFTEGWTNIIDTLKNYGEQYERTIEE